MRYNISDINDLMSYIQQRYPNLLSAADENGAEFNDGDKIYFTGDQVLESVDMNVVIDPETNQLKNTLNPDQQFKYKRFEFLFDYILMKIHNVNPEDNLTKTKMGIFLFNKNINSYRIQYANVYCLNDYINEIV